MGDGQGGGEGAAMDIERGPGRAGGGFLRWQAAQEQPASFERARNPELLLTGVERRRWRELLDEGALLVQDAAGRLGPAEVLGGLRIGRQLSAIGLIGREICKVDQAQRSVG